MSLLTLDKLTSLQGNVQQQCLYPRQDSKTALNSSDLIATHCHIWAFALHVKRVLKGKEVSPK